MKADGKKSHTHLNSKSKSQPESKSKSQPESKSKSQPESKSKSQPESQPDPDFQYNAERVERKIRWAEKIYEEKKMELLNPEIKDLIRELNDCIESTRLASEELGLIAICSECAEKIGSCCGKGIEDRLDKYLFLINRLMGVELPVERELDGCYFLGPGGCKLKAKEVLCLNYLCSKVYERMEFDYIIKLQKVSGKELDVLFLLLESVKSKINSFKFFEY